MEKEGQVDTVDVDPIIDRILAFKNKGLSHRDKIEEKTVNQICQMAS